MSVFADFPSFEAMFSPAAGVSVPLYLTLLNVSPEAGAAIDQIRTGIRASGEKLDAELDALLRQENWRPQVVAAAAIMLAEPSSDRIDMLWSAMARPSWTSPQLAAAASLIDPDFAAKAHARLDARCPISMAATGMSMAQRHSALGPSSLEGHSVKLLSALLALCLGRPDTPWAAQIEAEPDVQALLKHDIDRGGRIAVGWLSRMQRLLAR